MAEKPDTVDATNPATSFAPLKVRGIFRVPGDGRTLSLCFDRTPTNDEMRAIHEAADFNRTEPQNERIDPLDFLVLNEKALRLELAIRIVRTFAMSGVMLEGSGAVCDWLRDWVDGVNHGPAGGPMLWPSGIPAAAKYLLAAGFTRSPEGFVILKREPVAGEKVQ